MNEANKDFIVKQENTKSDIECIFGRIRDGEIKIDPDFQRNYVYDEKNASKLIESILLNIPIPSIFLSENKDYTCDVIDGVQRLTAIYKFINNEYKLIDLEYRSDLNGKEWKNLEDTDKRKIKRYSLNLNIFSSDCSEDLKFEIFSRLNQGSVKLNGQELRNCMYRGYLNDKVKELKNNRLIEEIFEGVKDQQKKIGKDRFEIEEIILRGLVKINFEALIGLGKTSSLNKQINTFMEKFQNSKVEVDLMVTKYLEVLKTIKDIMGVDIFYKGNNKNIHKALYDALLIAFKNEKSKDLMPNKDAIKECIIEKIVEKELESKAVTATQSTAETNAKILYDAIQKGKTIILDKNRLFSKELKEKMFNENNVCAICGNKIDDISECHIDHIIPWSKGGKTVPENAQLTHSICNQMKSNKIDYDLLKLDGSFRNKRPRILFIENKVYNYSTWKEIYISCIKYAYEKNNEVFIKCIEEGIWDKGQTKKIGFDQNDFRNASEKIISNNDKSIYIELNLSSDGMRLLLNKIFDDCNIDKNKITIGVLKDTI